MANKTNSSNNFFETMVDASSKAMETLVENTKKFTNGNTFVNETIEKTTDLLKKTVDATKDTIEKATSKTNTVKDEMKNGSEKMNEYFNNWKNQQIEWSKQMQEMNKNFMSNSMNTNNFQNPMNAFQNIMNNMNAQMDMNKWMNQMNPANMQTQMDQATEQMKNFWNQYNTVLNNNYQDLNKNFQNGTLADTYKGMFNMSEGFSKFYEMWMPMMKSMNEKSFNMDAFTQNMDMNKYKEFMDKYFSFMPQPSQDYMNNMKEMMMNASKTGTTQMNEMMNNMKGSMNNLMPNMMGNPYTTMLNSYNDMYGQMMNSVSPFAKLMTPTNDSKSMQEWSTIMNNMNIYNIKNAELQHMVYQKGMEVMEKLATNTMHKIENGEEVNSMMKLYQEYLNTSDKMYVEMFETDEYSKLMAEVSAMKLSIKKAVETQTEKMFANLPLAKSSEMDEVYQIIYDLKKQVRALQAMISGDNATVTAKKTTSTPTAKKVVVKKPVAKKAPAKKVANKKK